MSRKKLPNQVKVIAKTSEGEKAITFSLSHAQRCFDHELKMKPKDRIFSLDPNGEHDLIDGLIVFKAKKKSNDTGPKADSQDSKESEESGKSEQG